MPAPRCAGYSALPYTAPATLGALPMLTDLRAIVATDGERFVLLIYLQAWIAMYGSVVFWVGAWSMMDVDLNEVRFQWGQHLRDGAIGLLLLIGTDTFYQIGYVSGSMFPDMLGRSRPKRKPRILRRISDLLLHLRVLLALVGSVMLWNGLYNLLYWTPHEESLRVALQLTSVVPARGLKSAASIVLGLVLLSASGTLVAASRVPVNLRGLSEEDGPTWRSGWRSHASALWRASLSLAGQVTLWFGVYELLLTWCPGAALDDARRCLPLPYENAWKPLCFVSLGLVSYLSTDSFLGSAFLDSPSALERQERRSDGVTLALYLRCVLACLGSAVHNTGVWVLVDDTLFAGLWQNCSWRGETRDADWPCSTRHMLFIVTGYLIMVFTRAVAGQVGVSVQLTPTPALGRQGPAPEHPLEAEAEQPRAGMSDAGSDVGAPSEMCGLTDTPVRSKSARLPDREQPSASELAADRDGEDNKGVSV